MNRRNFLNWFGLGWLASVLTGAIAACSNDTVSQNSAPANASSSSNTSGSKPLGGFVQVGTIQELEQKGRLLSQQGERNSVLVIRDPSNPKQLYAVNAVCTHQGCAVDWNTDSKEVACPCHGSKFKPDGVVARGPATKPLKKYAAKIEGDAVLVQVI